MGRVEPGTGLPWMDAYAEHAAELAAVIDVLGVFRVADRRSMGFAVRAVNRSESRFFSSALPFDGADATLEDLPLSIARGIEEVWLRNEFAEAIKLTGSDDEDCFEVTRSLLEAARASALDSGAGEAQSRLWGQHRSYAVSAPDGRATQVVRCTRLTVTARNGAGRGVVSVADVPACPLTAQRAAEAGQRAALEASSLRTAASPESGTTVVVFAPEAAGLLIHEVVGHALEADVAPDARLWQERKSALTTGGLTVIESPADPWAWEQSKVDEEGTPCQEAVLVVGGRVAGVLADRTTGQGLGIASTGHGRRGSYASPPSPRMRHTVTEAGPDSAAGIVANTRRGILVQSIDTADAMPSLGRFSLRVRAGREIVKGIPGRALTGFTISGGLEEFRLIDAVGDDPVASAARCVRQGRWLPVSQVSPTLRFPRLWVRGEVAR